HASLKESAVTGQAEHKDEVDEGDERVDLDIGKGPLAGAIGRVAGSENLEEAHHDDQRSLLEGDDELVDRCGKRIAHGLWQEDAADAVPVANAQRHGR